MPQLDPSSERDQFAKAFVKALKAAGDTRTPKYDPKRFRIVYFEGERRVGQTELEKIFHEHSRLPEAERAADLQRLARAATEHASPQSFGDAKPLLMPVVRSLAFVRYSMAQTMLATGEWPKWPMNPMTEHLVISLALDNPESIQFIADGKTFEQWNTTPQEAYSHSLANLAAREFGFVVAGGGSLYICSTEDGYDASRLLLIPMTTEIKVKGDIVAMVPNRDMLLITGSRDRAGLEAMALLAKGAFEGPRKISGIPVRISQQDCSAWRPRIEGPLGDAFRELEIMTLAADYNSQTEIFKEVAEKMGREEFYAKFQVWEKDGKIRTTCLWQKLDCPIILPKAEVVLFGPEPGTIVAKARWDRVREVLGDAMEDTNHYPPRYKVTRFPTNAELRALKG